MKPIHLFMLVVCFVCMCATEAHAKCEKQTKIADLLQVGVEGEKAFADSNLAKLLMLSSRAREVVLPCLSEKVTPRDASAFHRLMAFEAFTHKDTKRVVAELHAARKLDPGYEFSLEVVPEEHRLRKFYEQSLLAEDGELKPVFPPDGGYVTVGGVRNAPRAEKTPAIVQAFDPFNNVLETRYLQPGETLPAWGKNPFGITAKDLGLEQTSAWIQPKTWYITAGAMAVVTGTLYGIAMYNKNQFQNTTVLGTAESDRKLQGYSDRANSFGVATIVSGSLTVVFAGLGAGFHVFGEDKPKETSGGKP